MREREIQRVRDLESQSAGELEKSCISHKTLRAAACLVNLPYTWAAMAGMFGSARVAELFGMAFGVSLRRPRGHVVATKKDRRGCCFVAPWEACVPYWVRLGAGFRLSIET